MSSVVLIVWLLISMTFYQIINHAMDISGYGSLLQLAVFLVYVFFVTIVPGFLLSFFFKQVTIHKRTSAAEQLSDLSLSLSKRFLTSRKYPVTESNLALVWVAAFYTLSRDCSVRKLNDFLPDAFLHSFSSYMPVSSKYDPLYLFAYDFLRDLTSPTDPYSQEGLIDSVTTLVIALTCDDDCEVPYITISSPDYVEFSKIILPLRAKALSLN